MFTIRFKMKEGEVFDLLRTCIIGEAYRACGVGFDPEDNLEVYHIDEFLENVHPDEVSGSWASPEAFLEMECSSWSGRIYETIYMMERSWKLNKSCLQKDWQKSIGKSLWELGQDEAMNYISVYGEENDSDYFIDKGNALFGI